MTKEVLERVKLIQQKLKRREDERKSLREIFSVYDVLRDYFKDLDKVQSVSREIAEKLRGRELLNSESFLKRSLRKEIRRIIRESIIKNFGFVEKIDEIERRIFINLEEEYG